MPAPPCRPDPHRFVIGALVFLTYCAYGFSWAATGTFLKQFMGDLGLTLSEASFVNTAVACAKIVGPVLAGAALARWGLRHAFLVGSSLIALGLLVPVSPSYAAILAARFAMGLGGAMVVVYFTPLAMQWFPERERVAVNGLNVVSVSVGSVVAMLATPPLQALLGGSWRAPLAVYGALSLLLAAAWALLGRESPSSMPEAPVAPAPETREARAVTPTATTPTSPRPVPAARDTLVDALRNPHTWILAWAQVGPLTVYIAILTYLPTFYQELARHLGAPVLAYAAVVPMAMGIPCTLLGIILASRRAPRRPLLRAAYAAVLPTFLGMYLLRDPAAILACAALNGVALFLPMPAFYSIPQELPGATPRRAASMMAIFWATCYGLTTVHIWMAGRLAEGPGGFAAGLAFIAAVDLVSLVGLFLLPETGRA